MNELTQENKQKRLLGIWDLEVSPISLGSLLILVEELQIQSIIYGVKYIDICIVGDNEYLKSISGKQWNRGLIKLPKDKVCEYSALLSIPHNLNAVDNYYLFATTQDLQKCLSLGAYLTWPALNEQGKPVSHRYDSTQFVQKFYCGKGFIPYLSCKRELLQWAMGFIERYVAPKLPIVVHLKNNPLEQNCSNADSQAWYNFFNECLNRYDVKFILIGNEKVDQRICELPNILIAYEVNSNLVQDLALIQMAFIFMGMASGPCNMAIFNDVPYIIFKNPNHHPEEMKLELGEFDRFIFARPSQKILRVFETSDRLISEFVYLYNHLNQQDWKKRIAKLTDTLLIKKENFL